MSGRQKRCFILFFRTDCPNLFSLILHRHKNMFQKTWKTFLFSISAIIKEQVLIVYFRFSSLSLSLFGIVVKTTTEVLEQNNKKSVFDRSIRILYLLVHKVFLHDAWNYMIKGKPNPESWGSSGGTRDTQWKRNRKSVVVNITPCCPLLFFV